jgi:hypothetical protein
MAASWLVDGGTASAAATRIPLRDEMQGAPKAAIHLLQGPWGGPRSAAGTSRCPVSLSKQIGAKSHDF